MDNFMKIPVFNGDPVGTILEPFFKRFEPFEYVVICLIKLIDNI